jgi:hypothetical protein
MVAFVPIAVLGLFPWITFAVIAAKVPGPVPALFIGAPSSSIDKPVTVAGGFQLIRQVTHGVVPAPVPLP